MHNTFMRSGLPLDIFSFRLPPAARMIAVFFCLVLVFSCRSTPREDPGALERAVLPELPPLLSLSYQRLLEVEEPDSQLFILRNAADSLVTLNEPELAEEFLNLALELARENYTGNRLAEVLVELSRLYTEAGIISQSLVLLQSALDEARREQDSQIRGPLVQEVITACFAIGTEAIELLRQAVQQIYIIEDYRLRSELLLDTARRYQESGEGQRSATLLQQAIPAAGSIAEPLPRARVFSQLGLRLANAGEQRLSQVYSRKAVEEIDRLAASPGGASLFGNQRSDDLLSDTLINLARSGLAADALRLNILIGNSRLRLGALLETARRFYADGQFLQADLVFGRIFTALEADAPADLVISVLLSLGQIYYERGDQFSADLYISAVDPYFAELENQLLQDSLLSETSLAYARIGQPEEGARRSAQIVDGLYASRAYIGLSDIIIEEWLRNNRESAEQARIASEYLANAASVSLDSQSIADSAFADIAVQYARLGEISEALAAVRRIENPFPAALGLARIQAYVVISEENNADIEMRWNQVSR